ncbi:hypothetical protein [Arvimicrobium flavum]|uniref:hypothetical protein n=1 Tax=Arvimicrobium flavum TaxID=3393320 RepID=UPI00237A6755|nr:hypothetical protein [Mesorhizobium shangrilense]
MKTRPQISSNGLIEYCYATPVRRAAIIANAIKPKNFLLDTRYNDIDRATMDFLESRGTDDRRLLALDQALLKRKPETSHEEQRLLAAHDAIELCRTLDLSALPLGSISSLPDKQPIYDLEGVAVSVRPTNLIVAPQIGRRDKGIGLIKPYISKSRPLSLDTSSLHGALLLMYAEDAYRSLGEPRHDLCAVIDIFAQRTFRAPRNYRQRAKMLKAACREIADRWPSIRSRIIETERRAHRRS